MSGICPILLAASKQHGELVTMTDKDAVECLKEACAWYVMFSVPNVEGCAVAKLADSLNSILQNQKT
jgi:hypothetical protein